MVALKLWHLLVLMICVLLPTAAAIVGGVWAVRRSRNSR
ncbi:putative membrane protein YqjE [Micromonospora sp. A200]|nr:putative membrane protein YqjE [Micromonospora sp. A200]